MSQDESLPAPTLRASNIEARRRRIIEAAGKLIAEGGMAAVSMRKLATEAGVAVTTLYNLYGSRDEILHALVEDGLERIVPLLDAEAPIDDPLARCRAIVTVSIDYFAEHETICRPMFVASFGALSAGGRVDRRLARRAAALQSESIAQAIAQGLLEDTLDPERLGEQIYHGYELACAQWAWGHLDIDGFRARALYGLYVALRAVARADVRGAIDAELDRLETELAARAIEPREVPLKERA